MSMDGWGEGPVMTAVSFQNTTIVHVVGSKEWRLKFICETGAIRTPFSCWFHFHMRTQALSSVSTSETVRSRPKVPRRIMHRWKPMFGRKKRLRVMSGIVQYFAI